ncbi:MAG: hypothetical protein JWN02_2742 [Acidobacteria bacterium]|nr:hypothetical protein [Acidobacteriota bacterium]
MTSSNRMNEMRIAEQIVAVLPAGSTVRVCSDDRETIHYAVRTGGMKLQEVVLRRESLRRLIEDPALPVKIEYLQRDLLRSAASTREFRYPRAARIASAQRPLPLAIASVS